MAPRFSLSPGRGGISNVPRRLSAADARAEWLMSVAGAISIRIGGGRMSPLRGWGRILGVLVSPRLRRGLHDRARYAGFSARTPGVQPKIGSTLNPYGGYNSARG